MKCNNCNTEMENLFYNPEGYGNQRLIVYSIKNFKTREYESLGMMKFCPNCGNVQVNVNTEQ